MERYKPKKSICALRRSVLSIPVSSELFNNYFVKLTSDHEFRACLACDKWICLSCNKGRDLWIPFPTLLTIDHSTISSPNSSWPCSLVAMSVLVAIRVRRLTGVETLLFMEQTGSLSSYVCGQPR